MMSKCTICHRPTDLELGDVTTDEQTARLNTIPSRPLYGICRETPCRDMAVYKALLQHKRSTGCTCEPGDDCEQPTEELHECPFDADVYDDPTPSCRCCVSCQARCADNI